MTTACTNAEKNLSDYRNNLNEERNIKKERKATNVHTGIRQTF